MNNQTLYVILALITLSMQHGVVLIKGIPGCPPTRICEINGLDDVVGNADNLPFLISLLQNNCIEAAALGGWNDHISYDLVLRNNGALAPYKKDTNDACHAFCIPKGYGCHRQKPHHVECPPVHHKPHHVECPPVHHKPPHVECPPVHPKPHHVECPPVYHKPHHVECPPVYHKGESRHIYYPSSHVYHHVKRRHVHFPSSHHVHHPKHHESSHKGHHHKKNHHVKHQHRRHHRKTRHHRGNRCDSSSTSSDTSCTSSYSSSPSCSSTSSRSCRTSSSPSCSSTSSSSSSSTSCSSSSSTSSSRKRNCPKYVKQRKFVYKNCKPFDKCKDRVKFAIENIKIVKTFVFNPCDIRDRERVKFREVTDKATDLIKWVELRPIFDGKRLTKEGYPTLLRFPIFLFEFKKFIGAKYCYRNVCLYLDCQGRLYVRIRETLYLVKFKKNVKFSPRHAFKHIKLCPVRGRKLDRLIQSGLAGVLFEERRND